MNIALEDDDEDLVEDDSGDSVDDGNPDVDIVVAEAGRADPLALVGIRAHGPSAAGLAPRGLHSGLRAARADGAART